MARKEKIPASDAPPVAAEAPDSKVAATVADVESGAPPQDEAAQPVEASEPEPVESPADARARAAGHPTAVAMLDMVPEILAGVSKWHAAAEHHARAMVKDHAAHVQFSRLAGLIAEFRNGLATL